VLCASNQNNNFTKETSMNRVYKSTAAILLLLPASMAALAAEPQKSTEPPMHGMGMHQGMMGMGMMGNMTEEQKDKHMQAMQEHMLQMHDLSNQILAEKDPAKKEQLKKQQLQLMKAHHSQMMQHRQDMKH
jgi:hypothetical protein